MAPPTVTVSTSGTTGGMNPSGNRKRVRSLKSVLAPTWGCYFGEGKPPLGPQKTSVYRILYFSRSANNVLDTMGLNHKTGKHLALLNQRCKVVMWYIQYMVLLQELLHPPRASRDDCGERIASVGTPLRAAFTVYLLLGFCAVFQRSLYKCSSP